MDLKKNQNHRSDTCMCVRMYVYMYVHRYVHMYVLPVVRYTLLHQMDIHKYTYSFRFNAETCHVRERMQCLSHCWQVSLPSTTTTTTTTTPTTSHDVPSRNKE